MELGRLEAALPSLDRVVFVEPLVLLGDEQVGLCGGEKLVGSSCRWVAVMG